MAVDWSNENVSEDSSVTVFTDSQSMCIALKGTSPAVDGLRRQSARLNPTLPSSGCLDIAVFQETNWPTQLQKPLPPSPAQVDT